MEDGDRQREKGLVPAVKRAFIPVVGGIASASGGLLAQLSELELSIAGVGGLLLTLVVRFQFSDSGGPQQHPERQSFEALRDADVSDRNDQVAFAEYRRVLAEAHLKWSTGQLATPQDRKTAKDSALELILNAECLRTSHAEKRPVTLVVVQGGLDFVVKRVAPLRLGMPIYPGMTCPHITSLESLTKRYAECGYVAEFPVCGEMYYLVALSDTPLSRTGRAIVEDAASHYQGIYQFFRMAAVAVPPALPPASTEV